MQTLNKTFDNRTSDQFEVLNFHQNLRVDKPVRRRSFYDRRTHTFLAITKGAKGTAFLCLSAFVVASLQSFKPDFGTGTASSNRLIMSSDVIPSDSAWKLIRMRCLNTG